MSLPSDEPGMARGRELRRRSQYTQMLQALLRLQKAVKSHIDLLIEPQGTVSEEQKASLNSLIDRVATLLRSGAASQPPAAPCPPRMVGVAPQELDQHQLASPRVAFVSPELSNRGNDIVNSLSSSYQDFLAYLRDRYHREDNPLGFINLGACENRLCSDLVAKRLSQKDMEHIEDTLLQYPDTRGHMFLRDELARFLTYYCKAPNLLDPENVVVLNGSCAIFCTLAMVLCNPGDAILTPTPSYAPFASAASLYAKVELIFVPLENEGGPEALPSFQLTVAKLEQALWDAQLKGKKVKGLLLINPQNPLGDVYSRDSLQEFLGFAKRNDLHMIVDERLMLSVFDENVSFYSVLSLNYLPDASRTHVIWSTSKDFGIAGFRFGTLYTHSKELAAAVGSLGFLHSLSGITQFKLLRLLQDREWINQTFLPTNRRRLRAAHRYTTTCLRSMKIPFLHRGAGLSIWISLRQFLRPCTSEEELRLHQCLLDHKLILTRGQDCLCSEPGWFCLSFAERMPLLEHSMFRFNQALIQYQHENAKRLLEDAVRE